MLNFFFNAHNVSFHLSLHSMQPLHTDLERWSVMKTVMPKVLVLYMVGISLLMRQEEMHYIGPPSVLVSFLLLL